MVWAKIINLWRLTWSFVFTETLEISFEVEVSGVHTAKQNKKATIYLWCMDETGAHGYIIKKVGEVPRNKIGKTVEELYEYSENLISQGYDCYEKVQAYLKELVKKEQIKKEEDNGAR